MKNIFVNVIAIASTVLAFLLIIAAGIVSIYGSNYIAMFMFYAASVLCVLAVWIIIYTRGDW